MTEVICMFRMEVQIHFFFNNFENWTQIKWLQTMLFGLKTYE